jgi:hypothetical protein
VVLIDGLTDVRSSARTRFAPTFTFCHIGLTSALIYIKPRRFYFFLFLSGSSPTLRRLTTAPRSRIRRVPQRCRRAVLRRCYRRILRAPRADPRRRLTSLPSHRAAPPPQLSSARATAAPPPTSHRAHPASSSHHHHVPSQPRRRTHSPTSSYLLMLPSPLRPTSTVVPHLGRVVPIADRSGERVDSIRRFIRQLVL